MQWYRAKILAYSSEERVCVGYLDFGNSEDVDIGHLRPISSSLLATPVQTIPCGLAGCLSSVMWIMFNFSYHIIFVRFPEMSFFLSQWIIHKQICMYHYLTCWHHYLTYVWSPQGCSLLGRTGQRNVSWPFSKGYPTEYCAWKFREHTKEGLW